MRSELPGLCIQKRIPRKYLKIEQGQFVPYILKQFDFRKALGPTQPPIQWVPGALSVGIKRPGREANYSPPSSAEVKE
jgi:hypothetical protein